MLKAAYDQAKELLSENREIMDKLAAYLIEKETITGKEFMQIFRREKGIPEPEEDKKEETAEESGNSEDTGKAEESAEKRNRRTGKEGKAPRRGNPGCLFRS